jgi:hypothetical protein
MLSSRHLADWKQLNATALRSATRGDAQLIGAPDRDRRRRREAVLGPPSQGEETWLQLPPPAICRSSTLEQLNNDYVHSWVCIAACAIAPGA